MGVKLVSASAGSVEIVAPTTASNYTATMPAGTGNVVVNGINSSIVSGTSQASTSGTSIDFTGIPSWVKRITVLFSGVSTNATAGSGVVIQLGVAGVATTSGYTSVISALGPTTISTVTGSTAGFTANTSIANAAVFTGQMVISNITGNTWVSSSNCARTDSALISVSDGVVALSGVMNLVRLTTTAGTDTFDAGTINILYE